MGEEESVYYWITWSLNFIDNRHYSLFRSILVIGINILINYISIFLNFFFNIGLSAAFPSNCELRNLLFCFVTFDMVLQTTNKYTRNQQIDYKCRIIFLHYTFILEVSLITSLSTFSYKNQCITTITSILNFIDINIILYLLLSSFVLTLLSNTFLYFLRLQY